MTETYQFAGRAVEISSLYNSVHILCKDYKTESSAQIHIEMTAEKLTNEFEYAKAADIAEGRAGAQHRAEDIENLAVYRALAEEFAERNIVVFHGSCIVVDGKGYIFTAKSGTGKSTHAGLWRKYLGDRAVMINDDKPLLELKEGKVIAHGSPWDGKHHLSCNRSVELQSIAILERSIDNHIEEISPEAAYPMILQQTYRPREADKLMKILDICDGITHATKLFRLGCNMDISAAELAYSAMSK